MAISLIGFGTTSYTGTSTSTFNFSSLVDISGAGSVTLAQNDMVVCYLAHSGTGTRTNAQLAPTTTGYSGNPIAASAVTSSDTDVLSTNGFFKFMGATPDTSVVLPGCAAATNSMSVVIFVYRGVDTTTPLAGVTPTTATAINGALPDPPSVTTPASPPTCMIVGVMAQAQATGAALTAPTTTPYDATANFVKATNNTATTNDSAILVGHKTGVAVSTAFNASAATGGTTANTNAAGAISFILKPAPITGAGSSSGTGAASGVGTGINSSPGSAAGSATVTAVGSSTAASAGSSAGVGAASGAGSSTAASTGSSAGTGAATAGGSTIVSAVGSSAAVGAASAAGSAVVNGVGSSAGSGAAAATGASVFAATGSAAGSGAASGTGGVTRAATGSAAAVGDANGVAASTVSGAGNAPGIGGAGAVATSIGSAAGSASATSSASGAGASTNAGTGSASCVATVNGVSEGGSIAAAAGSASGSSSVFAVGNVIFGAFGTALVNVSSATAVGQTQQLTFTNARSRRLPVPGSGRKRFRNVA